MANQISIRRDTSANWSAVDPILKEGEMGFDKTSNKIKVGDGSTKWSALASLPPAADVMAVKRVVFQAAGSSPGAVSGAGIYLLNPSSDVIVQSGLSSSALNEIATFGYYSSISGYSISGSTTKMSLRVVLNTNGKALGITLTFGLYPVTSSGSSGLMVITAGTVVSGSTCVFTTPPASTTTSVSSGTFDPPADGLYAIGVAQSGTQDASSDFTCRAYLQVSHV